jgi:Zn-dependent metalloprotease
MFFGDGDGRLFTRLTKSLDVIGHELTHGVTQYTLGLAYSHQSGALNEHISDAFGVMVKQFALGQTADQADWLIGAGLFTPQVHGLGLRSMKAPGTAYDDPILGKDPQPAHMRGYVQTANDSGGVHINSGIPNHAFYLAAAKLGGKVWEVVGRIWYETLTRSALTPIASFREFAQATYAKAAELGGAGGAVQLAIGEAWTAVGLPPDTTPQRPAPARALSPIHPALGVPSGPAWRRSPTV